MLDQTFIQDLGHPMSSNDSPQVCQLVLGFHKNLLILNFVTKYKPRVCSLIFKKKKGVKVSQWD